MDHTQSVCNDTLSEALLHSNMSSFCGGGNLTMAAAAATCQSSASTSSFISIPFKLEEQTWIGQFFLANAVATALVVTLGLWFAFRFLLPRDGETGGDHHRAEHEAFEKQLEVQRVTINRQAQRIEELTKTVNDLVDATKKLSQSQFKYNQQQLRGGGSTPSPSPKR